MPKLIRGLKLPQAVSVNMINMVGIGPFITMPLVMGSMHGSACLIAWLLGALLSFTDGMVWAELGAKWPLAGGSYVFLQNLYGRQKLGKMMSFLYVWQTTIQAPLVIASGAIGFSQYLNYLMPEQLSSMQEKMVSGAAVIFIAILLYRRITAVGKISVFMWVITGGTLLWLIVSGMFRFNAAQAFHFEPGSLDLTPMFFLALGQASIQTIYSFLGYYNVCQLGGEIVEPEKNIPRSIFLSIAGIAILYLLMQTVMLGVLPWQTAKDSKFVVSLFFAQIYNNQVAMVATALVLFIALSSLFSVMLGYSRVLYAAAKDGNYFPVFARLHPTKEFPNVSLLVLAGVAFCFSLLFKLKEVITAIITMRILIQFVSQSVGLILYHAKYKQEQFPFRMLLYPLPAIISICIWLYIFCSAKWEYMLGAAGIIVLGVMLYFVLFGNKQQAEESIRE
jgi:amino acid transporter